MSFLVKQQSIVSGNITITWVTPSSSGVPQKTPGVLIPAYYFVPTSSPYVSGTGFQTIINVQQLYPNVPIYCIINGQSSGPPTSNNVGYQAVISALQAAGVKVLGYIATGSGTVLASTVEGEINTWATYNVNGIFFDQMNYASGGSSYYFSLQTYCQGKGLNLIVGNPGVPTLQEYVGSCTIICTREDDDSSNPLPTSNLTQTTTGSPSGYAFLGYNTPTSSPNSTTLGYIANGAQWIYITDQVSPSQWSAVSSYFSNFVEILSGL